MSTILLLASLPAMAGYGDVDSEGYPSWNERAIHLWTNAARVDPEAFGDDYAQGGCSTADFSDDELTPKPPLYYSRDLNKAARFHSEDMQDNDFFSHDSSDGTSFEDRLARYYDSAAGENIAQGYPGAYEAVFEGWMCSTEGHRANIMSSSWHELGTGAAGTYLTQDFGAGAADSDGAVAMGIHNPEHSTGEAEFYADWQDDAGPATFEVVVNGEPSALTLTWGAADQGVYAAELSPSEEDCYEYYFRWETESGASGTFPETGSYLYGAHCDSDWTEGQIAPGSSGDWEEGGIKVTGCATLPVGRAVLLWVVAALGATLRRERALFARTD